MERASTLGPDTVLHSNTGGVDQQLRGVVAKRTQVLCSAAAPQMSASALFTALSVLRSEGLEQMFPRRTTWGRGGQWNLDGTQVGMFSFVF